MRREATIAIVSALCMTAYAFASPLLPITKGPVVSGSNPYTGPVNDPFAFQGQWFGQYGSQVGTEVAAYEFYDNIPGYGGGNLPDPAAFDGSRAIYGKVTSVVQAPGTGNITAFTIRSRITNDNPPIGPWLEGTNSHGESTLPRTALVGTLRRPLLTAEFALSDLNAVPAAWVAPYRQGQLPYIYATNEDMQAWYCWTPGHGDPSGGFFVPTWDFLVDIPIGAYAERDLTFGVGDAGLSAADPRYGNLMQSWNAPWGEGDVFFNRTTDLKIGDWLDNIETIDTGAAYPDNPLSCGNVSVFPEPATLLLLVLGGLTAIRRRTA